MHPTVQARQPGDCPICGMALEPVSRRREATAARGAAHFLSYGRGPVQRRVLQQPLDAPAQVDRQGVLRALLYEDELRAMPGGQHASFEALSPPKSSVEVQASAEPAVRWDDTRWQLGFRPTDAGSELRPGSAGRVVAALAPRTVLSVLAAAVVPSADGPSVLVVSADAHGVERRPIEVGRTLAGYTNVLAGLEERELVVVTNAFFLNAEQRLHPTPRPAWPP
jgi:multidrug efflux pump subunit AcrA (membrane-fusion protein)